MARAQREGTPAHDLLPSSAFKGRTFYYGDPDSWISGGCNLGVSVSGNTDAMERVIAYEAKVDAGCL